jgi:hypothetical protein
MGTVVTFRNKFRIAINSKDHNPPHFHIIHNNNMEGSAKVEIGTWKVLRKGIFTNSDLKELIEAAKAYEEQIKELWETYHGKNE